MKRATKDEQDDQSAGSCGHRDRRSAVRPLFQLIVQSENVRQWLIPSNRETTTKYVGVGCLLETVPLKITQGNKAAATAVLAAVDLVHQAIARRRLARP